MAPVIARDSLWTLEAYARERSVFRARVMAHKKQRTLHLGKHMTLLFEDELTMRYQIQEMLRIERIFEEKEIRDELAAYNPLIPDGHNWKATLLLEYADPAERIHWLTRLQGIEHRIWMKVGDEPVMRPVADEDMPCDNGDKTSAVHFLRFEVDVRSRQALRAGAELQAGVDHPAYTVSGQPCFGGLRQSLLRDLVE